MITVIPAGRNDADLILRMAEQVWGPTYGHILSTEQLEYMFAMMYSTASLMKQMEIGHQFLIAIKNQQACGFASFERREGGKTFKIHKLYVLPSAQGKGVGHQLMKYIAKYAEAMGGIKLSLNVNRYNKAFEFYIKEGFYKAGEEDIEIGNGYLMEDFIMERDLF